MINRFYIIDATDPNLSTILSYCVQKVRPVDDLVSARSRKDGDKILVYLYPGDNTQHEELLGYVEYNLEQIRLILDDEDWTGTITIE